MKARSFANATEYEVRKAVTVELLRLSLSSSKPEDGTTAGTAVASPPSLTAGAGAAAQAQADSVVTLAAAGAQAAVQTIDGQGVGHLASIRHAGTNIEVLWTDSHGDPHWCLPGQLSVQQSPSLMR